jgi:tetratricopeptide (TPR) repeat protein
MNAPNQIETAFETGNYRTVITLAAELQQMNAASWRMLGLSHLRLREFELAETPLTRASILGDPEAMIELGNLMRLMGRFEEAAQHFAHLGPMPAGELGLRLQRWWGTTEFQMGQVESGLARCEKAWHGYISLGDDELTGRITQTLAQMYSVLGNVSRALQLNKEALRVLSVDPVPYPRLSTLQSIAAIYIEARLFDDAEIYLKEARQILSNSEYYSDQWMILLLTNEADVYRLKEDRPRTLRALLELRELLNGTSEYESRVWVASRLAEFHSEQGQFAQALEALHAGVDAGEELPPALLVTRGVVFRRRGQIELALLDFEAALPGVRESGDSHLLTRALLHLSDSLRRMGRNQESVEVLREGLERLLQDKDKVRFRPDLEELSELTHSAMLEPDVAPFMEAVIEKIATLTGSVPLDEERLTHAQVETLGRTRVVVGGQPVSLTLHGSALMLVYLARHPGRTRQEIQLDLYPDKDPVAGSNYIRSVIRELREALGKGAVVHAGPHNMPRYSLGPGISLTIDVQEVELALERGDMARMLALYRGPFLKTVTDSEWADDLREQLQAAVTGAIRSQMRRAREAGDLKRALLLANQLLRVDPYDPEVLVERVEVARGVASPQEIARYVVEMQRMGS